MSQTTNNSNKVFCNENWKLAAQMVEDKHPHWYSKMSCQCMKSEFNNSLMQAKFPILFRAAVSKCASGSSQQLQCNFTATVEPYGANTDTDKDRILIWI